MSIAKIIGYETENHHRAVPMGEVGGYVAAHPDHVLELRCQRPTESTYYIPGTWEITEAGVLTWTPDATDTEISGRGKAQIWARGPETGEVGAVLAECEYHILRGVSGTMIEVPAPMQVYMERVLDAAAGVRQSAQRAETAAGDAEASRIAADQAATRAEKAAQEAGVSENNARAASDSAGRAATASLESATSAQSYAGKAEGAAAAAQADADSIHGLQADATTLDPGQSATASYDSTTNTLHFGIPSGGGSGVELDPTLTDPDKAAPADQVGAIKTAISDKLTEPETLAVGKYFRIAAIDANGHAVLECVDAPAGGITDVQVNGASVVAGGIANMPILRAKNGTGLVKVGSGAYGLTFDAGGNLVVSTAPIESIAARSPSSRQPIVPPNLDYAVKSAMCDGKGAAWSAEEQQAAQERMGFDWHTVTITEADFPVVSSGYSVYKIVPPDGYRFDEVQFLLQLARSTAGSAQAALNVGIHDTITDSGYHSINQNIPAANLFVQAGGRITCLSDYDTVFAGTAASNTTVYTSLPQTTNIGSALSRTLHVELRPSRTLTIGIGASFAIEHAYGVIKYRLVKAD